jgi:uncharacterized protein YbjT (DUF2867 family)
MRILVVGASGFIGSAVASRLAADGHEVITASRSRANVDYFSQLSIDMSEAVSPADWTAAVHHVDAVVNCAGVFQDGIGDSTKDVHVEGPNALFAACEQYGVRRVIHLSAAGIDRGTPTAFSRSKREGEAALMARDLDWIILRPGVVIGRSAYGGPRCDRPVPTMDAMVSRPIV